tara:strand:+ start:204 stop:458 length:255 start_codon:yes stop_codon:yes gene_type:complete
MRRPRLTRPIAAALKSAACILDGEAETLNYDSGIKQEYAEEGFGNTEDAIESAKEFAKQANDLYLVRDYIYDLARWYEAKQRGE